MDFPLTSIQWILENLIRLEDVRLIVIIYLIKLDTLGSAHATTNTILDVVLFI